MESDPLLLQAIESFEKEYGARPVAGAFAPGRVNIIGGHTDYNQGLTLPFAIEQKIITLVSPRTDDIVRARSLQIGKPVRFSLNDKEKKNRWDDTIRGVIDQLKICGAELPGMNILFSGNVPIEAGLSSSAAFTVSAAICLGTLAEMTFEPKEAALLAQRVEQLFMGVQCGLLDQMASAAGQIGHALLFDCSDLSVRPVSLGESVEFVVCHTGIKRKLAAGKYNERRAECNEGVTALQKEFPKIKSLRDINTDQLHLAQKILNPVIFSRVRHVVTENERVQRAVVQLETGNVEEFGKLIYQSHVSLRDDYEVSCPELDAMMDIAVSLSGCLGARLVGAGFGGCAVSVVKKENLEAFLDAIPARYLLKTNKDGQFFHVKPGEGAKLYYL